MAAKRASTRTAKPKKTGSAAVQTGESQHRTRGGTSPWEWAAATLGAAILCAIVVYLIYEGVSRPIESRPLIVVTGGEVVAFPDQGYLVPIRVENRGHTTGAGVGVSGVLLDAEGGTVEESTVTFDFVAQHSRESGGLYFTSDPRSFRLVLRVEGYTDP
jgi:uncharacterized protein (TIGR02588 family)